MKKRQFCQSGTGSATRLIHQMEVLDALVLTLKRSNAMLTIAQLTVIGQLGARGPLVAKHAVPVIE